MHPGLRTLLGTSLLVLTLLAMGLFDTDSRGDEPSRLGRLFRLGTGGASSPAPPPRSPIDPSPATPALLPPPTSAPATPTETASESSARLVPQPRVSRAVTESDPILTRVSIGRSDNGSRFGMFLQVYADGTVLDGEGIHQVSRETLKPLIEAIQASDAFRLRGHCGGAPTDFIEQVHLVVYERNLGRLRSNAFSYSGNPQGCDHAIKHLQTAVEAIQAKISGVPSVASPTTPAEATIPTLSSPAPAPSTNARPIPLTPLN